MAIRSFASRKTRRFAKGDTRRLPPALATKIISVLEQLDSLSDPADILQLGHQTHALTGDRKGFFAVPISGAWRVVFRFADGNVYDVEVVDYHRS